MKSTDGGKTFTRMSSFQLGVQVQLDPESPNVLYASQSRTVGVDVAEATPSSRPAFS